MDLSNHLLSAKAAGADGASFFTWESIGTFTGSVALVVFLVQLLKLPIDRIWKIPTQYVAYGISLTVLLLSRVFAPGQGALDVQSVLLCVLNAAVVSLSAMSAYDMAINRVEEKKHRNAG